MGTPDPNDDLIAKLRERMANRTPEEKAKAKANSDAFMERQQKEWAVRHTFAEHFVDMQCGMLHLAWFIDSYWARVTKNIILPTALNVYDKLVKKKYTENKKFSFNDADDCAFHISSESGKVFVHTTQNRDFLYVISEEKDYSIQLHIRRIWREYDKEHFYPSEDVVLKDMKTALDNVEAMSDYHDNHSMYPQRPGLEYYKDIDFQIPSKKDKHVNKSLRRTYGDFRDAGYILSYEKHDSKYHDPDGRCEGTKLVYHDLEIISTCYLTCLADCLGVKHANLNGYKR